MPTVIDTDSKIIQPRLWCFGGTPVKSYGTNQLYACHLTNVNEYEVHWFNGTVWALSATFTDLGMDSGSIAISELGDVFFCYQYTVVSRGNLKVKKRDHITGLWTEVLNYTGIPDSSTNPPNPHITYSRFENKLVVSCGYHDGGGVHQVRTWYSTDYGNTFTPTLHTIVGGQNPPQYTSMWNLDTDPSNGDIWFMYQYYNNSPLGYSWGLWKQDKDGASPGAPYYEMTATNIKAGAMLLDSSGNKVYAVYRENGGNYWLSAYRNLGSTTNLAGGGTTPFIYDGMMAMGRDNSDNIYLFYVRIDDGLVHYRKYDFVGASWGAEQALSPGQARRVGADQNPSPANPRVNVVYYTSV